MKKKRKKGQRTSKTSTKNHTKKKLTPLQKPNERHKKNKQKKNDAITPVRRQSPPTSVTSASSLGEAEAGNPHTSLCRRQGACGKVGNVAKSPENGPTWGSWYTAFGSFLRHQSFFLGSRGIFEPQPSVFCGKRWHLFI